MPCGETPAIADRQVKVEVIHTSRDPVEEITTTTMRHSIARLAQAQAAAKAAKASPYAWINPAAAGPSSGMHCAGGADPRSPVRARGRDQGQYLVQRRADRVRVGYPRGWVAVLAELTEGYVPPYDATCVKLLAAAGAHIAGKTKMDEFGMGWVLCGVALTADRKTRTCPQGTRRYTIRAVRGVSCARREEAPAARPQQWPRAAPGRK